MVDDGGPVFPTPVVVTGSHNTVHTIATSGITLRDFFAAIAMLQSATAESAYRKADRLIEEKRRSEK